MQIIHSVNALFFRNIQQKFIITANTRRLVAVSWVLVEPAVHVLVWIILREYFFNSILQTQLPAPLFILLGALPFLFFSKVVSYSLNAIASNRGLYMYRQIKPIDPIIAKLLSELFISTVVFIGFLMMYAWLSIPWHLYDLQRFLMGTIAYVLFIFGLSLFFSVLGFFFHFVSRIFDIAMRFMYILSGIFFSVSMLPEYIRSYVYFNPILQYIELVRSCFCSTSAVYQAGSLDYLIKAALLSCFVGLAAYITNRKKIMTDILQR